MKTRSATALAVAALMWCGCAQDDLEEPEELPELDEHFFRCQVQPVLASSCAFMDCHGNADRPFSIYAEQRYRLDIPWDDFEAELTDEELAANLLTVRGFVSTDGSAPNLLSEKPLDTRAGGLFHRGRDLYGDEDVFTSREDARYRVLRDAAEGASDDAGCTPREDLGL